MTLQHCIVCIFVATATVVVASPTHVVHVMIDDLGYNDLAFTNDHKSVTPNIDALVADGIWLTHYHTFKICSPSRASLHTGRYPFNAGFYDMSVDHDHTTTNYTLLPELMKSKGYRTHAIGKWDIGFAHKESTATYRGYETWLGYYTACVADYFYHWSSTSSDSCGYGSDFSFNNGTTIAGARGYNGTYDRLVFSNRASEIIRQHDVREPLFLYLAFQNVHLACGFGRDMGINAPCASVKQFPNVVNDTYKVQSANLLELDYGLGNLTQDLKAAGMWDDTIIIATSDNVCVWLPRSNAAAPLHPRCGHPQGGPLDHTTNFPLRGGKHTFWDGGVRVMSFMSGGAVPQSRRGTQWHGLAHSSDWYRTVFEGIAGGKLPSNTGYMPPDSVNLWDAIMDNEDSPRTEIVHQVWNSYFNESVSAMRMGKYKLIRGMPGDSRVLSWPPPANHPVAFGNSGGVQEAGTDHCRAPPGKGPSHVVKQCIPYCLFDLEADPSESNDLAGDPSFATVIQQISARLDEYGARAPLPAYDIPTKTFQNKTQQQLCSIMNSTGYLLPLDHSDD